MLLQRDWELGNLCKGKHKVLSPCQCRQKSTLSTGEKKSLAFESAWHPTSSLSFFFTVSIVSIWTGVLHALPMFPFSDPTLMLWAQPLLSLLYVAFRQLWDLISGWSTVLREAKAYGRIPILPHIVRSSYWIVRLKNSRISLRASLFGPNQKTY